MRPVVNIFDRPLLRKFAATMVLLLGIWLLFDFIFNRTISGWESAYWFEVVYLLPLLWFGANATHRQSFALPFRGLAMGSLKWYHLLLVLALAMVSSYGIDHLMSMLVGVFAPAYIVGSLNLEVIEHSAPWFVNLWLVLGAAVITPFMEELVFRGLLFERLARKWNTPKAMLISSLIFGLLHAEAWLGAALFGFLMCLVYYHTRNLWMPIILHIGNNLLVVGMIYFDSGRQVTLQDLGEGLPYYLISLLVLPVLFYFIKRYYPDKDATPPFAQILNSHPELS